MNDILNKLEEGDLRSIGNVPEIVDMALDNPKMFDFVVKGMVHADAGVRMRASDAVEKITRIKPEFLKPYKEYLLKEVILQTQQEVRWHLAQVIPRLELNDLERTQAVEELFTFLDDPSKIVQTNALQALVDLAWENDRLFSRVKIAVENLVETGSPAVKNRADKLLPTLVRNTGNKQS